MLCPLKEESVILQNIDNQQHATCIGLKPGWRAGVACHPPAVNPAPSCATPDNATLTVRCRSCPQQGKLMMTRPSEAIVVNCFSS